MKPVVLLLTGLLVLACPSLAIACGACTDEILMITMPWARCGVLFVWAWLATMVVARVCRRCRGRDDGNAVVQGWTLAGFAILGSLGVVGVAYLSLGSVLFPSLFVGFIWFAYVLVRLAVDIVCVIWKRRSGLWTPLAIHSLFLLAVVVVVVRAQERARSLEHCIACLRYGPHAQVPSIVIPRVVAYGEDAVEPLIQVTNAALERKDDMRRTPTITRATYCLACIGGQRSEQFLAQALKQHGKPGDYSDQECCRSVCFAYARCAGPRAADGLMAAFEEMPVNDGQDDRWAPLVALLVSGSKQGVVFVLDHMDVLVSQMNACGDDSEGMMIQAALDCLVFGSDPTALTQIPVQRNMWVIDDRSFAAPGRHSEQEITSAWAADSDAIRNRWTEMLK